MELAFTQHDKKRLFAQFVGNLVYKYDDDEKVDSHLKKLAESENSTVDRLLFTTKLDSLSTVATG